MRTTPVSQSRSGKPSDSNDLILKMSNSLTWNKACQVSIMVIVAGVTMAMALWGLGQLDHPAAAPAWSAIGSLAAGGGTGVVICGITRHHRRGGRGA
jgi:hypothetical protein